MLEFHHMEHKHHSPVFVIVILFVIIFVTMLLLREKTEMTQKESMQGQSAQVAPAYKCGLTATSPVAGATISFPLAIIGGINNLASTDGCTWTMFEGMAGTVSVSTGGTVLATVGLAVVGDWTGNAPVTFSGILNPPNAIASGTALTLTFNEEDPSGQNLGDSLSYQVVAQ